MRDPVVRERLHQQHRAVQRQGIGGVPGGGHRVAQIVQAVDEADQPVRRAGIVHRGGDLEADPIGGPEILATQRWLGEHFAVANPVEEMIRRSRLAERTFKRRFTNATGYAPLVYVQHLRIEEAKRRLESSNDPVDEIGWQVGYEDPAFFRRLFKRLTGASPGHYRRQFQIPSYALPEAAKQPELAR